MAAHCGSTLARSAVFALLNTSGGPAWERVPQMENAATGNGPSPAAEKELLDVLQAAGFAAAEIKRYKLPGKTKETKCVFGVSVKNAEC